MAGGLSPEDLLTIFHTIEHPVTSDEIRSIRGDAIDQSGLTAKLGSGVSYGYLVESEGKFFPTDKLLSYGIERMQKAVTLYQDWHDSLKRQQEFLHKESTQQLQQ